LNKQCQRVSKWIFAFNPSEESGDDIGEETIGKSEEMRGLFKLKQYEVKINSTSMEERRESIGQ
jgi:hypothetical protein